MRALFGAYLTYISKLFAQSWPRLSYRDVIHLSRPGEWGIEPSNVFCCPFPRAPSQVAVYVILHSLKLVVQVWRRSRQAHAAWLISAEAQIAGETTRYNDSLTLFARGKIRRENSTVFITPNKLATKQTRQPAINYPRQGIAGTVARYNGLRGSPSCPSGNSCYVLSLSLLLK